MSNVRACLSTTLPFKKVMLLSTSLFKDANYD
jgi:hypothetical protein